MNLALSLCAGALTIGAILAALRGPGVILLGAVGVALGLLYSLPGAQLSVRGVGEVAVALGLGVLPVLGSVWLQTGFVDSGGILLCVTVSCWVAAILIINEVPDVESDRLANKRTLVVRWGAAGAPLFYRGLTVIALAASVAAVAAVAAVARHALPMWYLIPAVVLATLGMVAAHRISMDSAARPRLKRGIELTLLAIQALGCIAMGVALLLQRFA